MKNGITRKYNKLTEEYLKTNQVDTARGQCYNEAESFYWWLVEEKGLENVRVVDGLFEIDRPVDLPLSLQDLKSDEYEEFLDLYDDNFDLYTEEELSEVIWEYVNKYTDRRSDFYYIPHAWVEVDGIIIDVTVEQFDKAIDQRSSARYFNE